jgi:hypothetical protein
MPTRMAAYYLGCLAENSFRAEMKDHGIKPVALRGRRIGWLIEDLDRYRLTKAGHLSTPGNEWLDAIDAG